MPVAARRAGKFYFQMAESNDESRVAVARSTDLPVRAAALWACIRDFNAMPAWNASVRRSHIEDGPADRIGCLRVLEFDDGGIWTHQLTGLSDVDMKLQYRIVATPQPMRIPVANYRAEILITESAELAHDSARQACHIRWSAQFETAHAHAMAERACQVFDQGFAGLRRLFGV